MRKVGRIAAVVWALAGFLTGCAATYAPPPRAGTSGSPVPLEAGRMSVGVAVEFVSPIPLLDAVLTVDATDWLAVEAGANWANHGWALAWAGVRFEAVGEGDREARFVLDFDAGGAAGVGGRRCSNGSGANEDCPPDGQPDGRDWTDRIAGGGYLGGGLALHLSWFSIFLRDRVSVSAAEGVPPTVWNLLSTGLQAAPIDLFRFWTAFTWGVYWNDLDDGRGGAFELGVAFTFDAWDATG